MLKPPTSTIHLDFAACTHSCSLQGLPKKRCMCPLLAYIILKARRWGKKTHKPCVWIIESTLGILGIIIKSSKMFRNYHWINPSETFVGLIFTHQRNSCDSFILVGSRPAAPRLGKSPATAQSWALAHCVAPDVLGYHGIGGWGSCFLL